MYIVQRSIDLNSDSKLDSSSKSLTSDRSSITSGVAPPVIADCHLIILILHVSL